MADNKMDITILVTTTEEETLAISTVDLGEKTFDLGPISNQLDPKHTSNHLFHTDFVKICLVLQLHLVPLAEQKHAAALEAKHYFPECW